MVTGQGGSQFHSRHEGPGRTRLPVQMQRNQPVLRSSHLAFYRVNRAGAGPLRPLRSETVSKTGPAVSSLRSGQNLRSEDLGPEAQEGSLELPTTQQTSTPHSAPPHPPVPCPLRGPARCFVAGGAGSGPHGVSLPVRGPSRLWFPVSAMAIAVAPAGEGRMRAVMEVEHGREGWRVLCAQEALPVATVLSGAAAGPPESLGPSGPGPGSCSPPAPSAPRDPVLPTGSSPCDHPGFLGRRLPPRGSG